MSSALAVPDQCEGMRGEGEKRNLSFYPPGAGGRQDRDRLFASLLFMLEGKKLTCPIKTISYISNEYFSLFGTGHMMFFSLMQFSVRSDLPDILCVALYLSPQLYFTVPMRKSMYQTFQLQSHQCQVQPADPRATPRAQRNG